MNLIEAVKSGRPFRRLDQTPYWITLTEGSADNMLFDYSDIVADDYVLKVNLVQKWQYVMRAKEPLPNEQTLYVSENSYSDAYVQENTFKLGFVQKIAGTCVEVEE